MRERRATEEWRKEMRDALGDVKRMSLRSIAQFREGAIMEFAKELIEGYVPRALRPSADDVVARINGLSNLSKDNRYERVVCATELMRMAVDNPEGENIAPVLLTLYEYLGYWNSARPGSMDAEEDRVFLPVLGGILMRGMGPVELERRLAGGDGESFDASALDCVYPLEDVGNSSAKDPLHLRTKALEQIEKGGEPVGIGYCYEVLGNLVGLEEMPTITAGLKSPHDAVQRHCANAIMNVFADNKKYLAASRHVPPAVAALHECMKETKDDRVFMASAAAIFVSRMGPMEARRRLEQDLREGRYEGPRPRFGPRDKEKPAGAKVVTLRPRKQTPNAR